MIGGSDITRVQAQIGRLAMEAVRIDLDGFIEATEAVGSPQALAAGIDPKGVSGAAQWVEIARLLKPFRDDAVQRVGDIRAAVGEQSGDLVPQEAACPSCGERRSDELALNEDYSVLRTTCGRRYQLPGREDGTG